MFKKIIILVLIVTNINVFAQLTTKEGITIEIQKAKLVDNISVFGIRQLKVTNDDLRKVMIKIKIKSSRENKTKLSAFYLLDIKNKIRYRLADYKGYTGIIGFPELIPYRKDKIYKENGKELTGDLLPPYDESVKDYFNDFDKNGFTNFEMKINFGTNDKPKLSTVYFGETIYKNFTAELFFAIIETNKDSDYELYYKNEKISDITFE